MARPSRTETILILVLSVMTGSTSGCIELQYLLGTCPPRGGSGAPPDDGNGGGGGGDSDGVDSDSLIVRLSASNVTPQLDETVTLACSLISGNVVGATFSFESTRPRLQADPNLGTARFVIESADLGTAYSFSCSANLLGTEGPPSSTLIITPTDVAAP